MGRSVCRREKSKQLPRQVGGAVGVLLDLHDIGEGRIARLVARQQQIAKTDDRRQQIVEVMRDAARELADGLHLLRLRELHLERFLLGRVDQIDDQRRALARIDARGAELADPLCIAQQVNIDRGPRQLARSRAAQQFVDGRAIVLGHEIGEPHPAFDALADACLARGAAGIVDPAFLIDRRNADRRIVEEARKPHLGIAGRHLGLVAGRPVEHQRKDVRRPTANAVELDCG